ncbi:MAG: hypothetical protein ABIH78_00585 [Candidatus Peregrinibacteria bacterium]
MPGKEIPKENVEKTVTEAVSENKPEKPFTSERQKTAETIAENLYESSEEKMDETFGSLGKLISHILKLFQALFSEEGFKEAFSDKTQEVTGKQETKEETKPLKMTEKGAKLREIWPETRVPERYWINLADGMDKRTGLPRGQSFGPFQFYRNSFTDFTKYVKTNDPARYASLSQSVKTKIEQQTQLFERKKSGTSLTKEEIQRTFLNMAEAQELIAKIFRPPDLAYEYRAGQFFDKKLPRIATSTIEAYPQYKQTIEKLTVDKRYLAAIFDLSNQLGPGGAINVIKAALKDLQAKSTTNPSFNEMFTSLVKASYKVYGFRRAVRTLGALAMACGQTDGKMDRTKMGPLINRFLASNETQREQIIENAKTGNLS